MSEPQTAVESQNGSEPLDALIITREFTGDGRFNVRLNLAGDMRPTELISVLETALRAARAQIGAQS